MCIDEKKEELIKFWLKRVTKEWEIDLEDIPADIKNTVQVSQSRGYPGRGRHKKYSAGQAKAFLKIQPILHDRSRVSDLSLVTATKLN
jgi:hypothetical protein